MKKIIFALAILFTTLTSAYAQSDSYRQKATKVMEVAMSDIQPQKMSDTFKGLFGSIMKSAAPTDQAEDMSELFDLMSTEVFDPYFGTNEFLDDMINIMLPHLQKEFSEQELDELINIYSAPNIRNINQKAGDVLVNLGGMMQELMPAIMSISSGQKAPAVEKVKCDAEYRKLFMQYYALTTNNKMAELEQKFGGKNGDMYKYMSEALPEMALKMMYTNYTIDELKDLVTLMSNPLVQRYTKVAGSINQADMAIIGTKISTRFKNFLQKLQEGEK